MWDMAVIVYPLRGGFPSIVFYFYFPLLYFPCYYNFQIRKWHTACPSLSLYKYCKVLLD